MRPTGEPHGRQMTPACSWGGCLAQSLPSFYVSGETGSPALYTDAKTAVFPEGDPMAEPRLRRWTSAEVEKLDDQDGWIRYEIIDGELYVSHAASDDHQDAAMRTSGYLFIWNEQTVLGLVMQAPGLIFDDENNTIPDVVWVSRERRARIEQARDRKLHDGPELIVEVLSPGAENERRDREIKLALYARRNVDEYWILDIPARTVSVYRRQGAELVLVARLGAGATLTSPHLPGFQVDVTRLFPE